MPVSGILWPEERVDHIGQHGVRPEEFEEVCFGVSLVLRAKATGPNPVYYVLGETEPMMPKIPTTDSIQELATFWQRHDVTDFEDDLEEVPRPVFQRAHVVGVPLSGDEHQAVRDAATSRGLDEAALIHEWVKERLRHA